jgi:hypothetical protein
MNAKDLREKSRGRVAGRTAAICAASSSTCAMQRADGPGRGKPTSSACVRKNIAKIKTVLGERRKRAGSKP